MLGTEYNLDKLITTRDDSHCLMNGFRSFQLKARAKADDRRGGETEERLNEIAC